MKYFTVICFFIMTEVCFGKIPSWATNDTITKSGDRVTSVCEGTGSSVSIARQEAIQNCQASVSQFLNGEVKINALSVETEKDVGFHQQVEQRLNVKNFNCEPVKDEIVQNENNYTYWIKCKFDTKKIITIPSINEDNSPQIKDSGLKSVERLKSKDIAEGKVLILETIPQCDSILVKGIKARTITCKTNPLSLVIYDKDEQIIIRLKDYQPKTLNIKEGFKNEKLSVLLERN